MKKTGSAAATQVVLLVDVETGEWNAPGRFLPDAHSVERRVLTALKAQHRCVTVLPYENVRRTGAHLARLQPDVVFNLTEWIDGDRRKDAVIARQLDRLGYCYTGAGPRGLTIARDKVRAKALVARLGIAVPRHVILRKPREPLGGRVAFPVIAKPQFGDGSDGIDTRAIIRSPGQFQLRVRGAFARGQAPLLCEEYIEGRDLFVGLLGNRPEVMEPLELVVGRGGPGAPAIATQRVKNDAAYRRRWRIGYQVARLAPALRRELIEGSRRIFHALHLRDYARIDYRLAADGTLYFLEANPNPDLGPHTFGRNRCFAGVRYADLVRTIVESARRRH